MLMRWMTIVVLGVLSGSLEAGLVDRCFPGKKEEEVAKEFLKKLPESLKNFVATKNPPRATLVVQKRVTLFAELAEVQGKGDNNIWVELVKKSWFTNGAGFEWGRSDAQFFYKTSDIPAAQVGGWFDGRTAAPEFVVGLCVWLARNNELKVANQRLTEMVSDKKDLRADVDAWLCEKYKWTLPENGALRLTGTFDLATGQGSGLLMSDDAYAEYLTKLSASAKETLSNMEAARGDATGELGTRKKPASERLDDLRLRCERFPQAFKNAAVLEDPDFVKHLEAFKASLEADLLEIKTISEAAEAGLKADPLSAAKSFDRLSKADPANPTWRSRLAYAYHLAGGLHFDGGCDDPKSMKKGADLYVALCAEFPLNGGLYTFGGACLYSVGERDKAKKYLERAVALSEPESQNQQFAARLLKNLK